MRIEFEKDVQNHDYGMVLKDFQGLPSRDVSNQSYYKKGYAVDTSSSSIKLYLDGEYIDGWVKGGWKNLNDYDVFVKNLMKGLRRWKEYLKEEVYMREEWQGKVIYSDDDILKEGDDE